jgi:hypothetical protein
MPPHPQKFSRLAEKTIGEFRGIPPGVPEKMRARPTQGMGEVIEQLRVKFRIGRSAPDDAVREAWADIVGTANASYSQPLRLEGSRLLVGATHSVVRNELFLHREEIVQRVQKVPGCSEVTQIRIYSA